jgi:IS5 family transposase
LLGGWHLLGGEGQAQTGAEIIGLAEETQQETWLGPGQGGACVPGDQMPVGYRKVRYRGLAKNEAQLLTLTALANIFLARKRLQPESV